MRRPVLTPEEARARAAERTRAWKQSAAGRAYNKKNRKKINANKRAWRLRNRDKENARLAERRKDPEFRAKAAAANDKWRKSIGEAAYWARVRARQKARPDFAAKMKLWNQRSYAKLVSTPEGVARLRKWQHATYARIKADPVKLAKHRENTRQCQRKLMDRLRADPERYAAYKVTQRECQRRHRLQRILREKPGYVESMMANIQRMIPRSLHPELRDDLLNDFLRDILAGALTVEQIPQVMRKYKAQASSMLHSDYEFSSLDDVIPGTDNLKRIDTIAAGTSIYTAVQYKNKNRSGKPGTAQRAAENYRAWYAQLKADPVRYKAWRAEKKRKEAGTHYDSKLTGRASELRKRAKRLDALRVSDPAKWAKLTARAIVRQRAAAAR